MMNPIEKPLKRDISPAWKLYILLVDDDSINQVVAQNFLKSLGCKIDLAENGQEAVSLFSRYQYDLIFMDCSMPVMDGYEATKQIRKQERDTHHVPIVALTAHAMEGDKDKCLNAGMDDYLSKPLRKENLEKMLSKYTIGNSIKSSQQSHGFAKTKTHPSSKEETSLGQTTLHDAEHTIFDSSHVLNCIEHDIELMNEIVAAFLEDTPSIIEQLQTALDNHEVDQAQKAAHKLKGSAANLGAMKLSELASQIDQASKQNNLETCQGLYQPLCDSFHELKKWLDKREWENE